VGHLRVASGLNHIFIAGGARRAASIAAPAAGRRARFLYYCHYIIFGRPAIHAKLFSPIHVNQFVFSPLAAWGISEGADFH
jgi:hypothetical protein